MSPNKELFSSYPQKIVVSIRQPSLTYTLLPSYYAVHDPKPDTPSQEDAAYLFNEGTIAVFQGTPDRSEGAGANVKLGPVYALQPGGAIAVPTGLVFMRFAEGTTVEKHLEEIKQAGYEVAESLSYAPHAAWLRARSGKMADALAHLDALEKIPEVQSVEPQMLMESARR